MGKTTFKKSSVLYEVIVDLTFQNIDTPKRYCFEYENKEKAKKVYTILKKGYMEIDESGLNITSGTDKPELFKTVINTVRAVCNIQGFPVHLPVLTIKTIKRQEIEEFDI